MFRKVRERALAEHSIVGILRLLGGKTWMKRPVKTERDLEYYKNTLELIKRYEKEGFVTSKADKVVLTGLGQKLVEKIFSACKNNKISYSTGEFHLGTPYKEIVTELQGVHKKFSPRRELDQAPLSTSSAVAKIAYAIKRGDVIGKRVVCIGDDDFLSIILALTGKPKEVLAIDLDKRVLSTIEELSKKTKIEIGTLKHDLRKPVQTKYRNRYDTAFFWSSDTEVGFNLFASRGIELLREGGAIYANVTPSWCHPLELLGIRRGIFEMGLKITDFVKDSGEYIFANKTWKVDLIRMEKSRTSKPMCRILRDKIPY